MPRIDSLPPLVLIGVALVGGLLFQALLGTSYVAGSLDPVGASTGLPVALVDEDRGPHARALVARLLAADAAPVAWRVLPDRDAAVRALEEKGMMGALVLPRGFSDALDSFASDAPRAARVETIANPGASTAGNVVAQRALDAVLDAARAHVRDEALARTSEATLGFGSLTLAQGRFIAEPIVAQQTTVNPVPTNGAAGLAPAYITMAAWIGGYIGAIALERFRERTHIAPGTRALVMGAAALAQAAVATTLFAAVGLHMDDPVRVFCVVALGTWMAYAIVSLLLDVAGLAGALPAFAVLALGLPAAGAFYPVEMLPEFFRAIHPVDPLAWLHDALRTTLYAPAAADLAPNATKLALLALAATAASIVWARARSRRLVST